MLLLQGTSFFQQKECIWKQICFPSEPLMTTQLGWPLDFILEREKKCMVHASGEGRGRERLLIRLHTQPGARSYDPEILTWVEIKNLPSLTEPRCPINKNNAFGSKFLFLQSLQWQLSLAELLISFSWCLE